MVMRCEHPINYLNEVLNVFFVHIIGVHKMYQCLVQLCEVFAIKNILTVNIEELKHQLYLHFKEHKCAIFKNRLEKHGGCAIKCVGE